jgi:hypothetical protein
MLELPTSTPGAAPQAAIRTAYVVAAESDPIETAIRPLRETLEPDTTYTPGETCDATAATLMLASGSKSLARGEIAAAAAAKAVASPTEVIFHDGRITTGGAPDWGATAALQPSDGSDAEELTRTSAAATH